MWVMHYMSPFKSSENGYFCEFVCQIKWATKEWFNNQTDLQWLLKFNLTDKQLSVIWFECAGECVNVH